MSLWGRIFAVGYERVIASSERAGLADRRAALLAGARGRALEIGPGPAMNLRHYPRSVEEVVLAEPEEAMARRLEKKMAKQGLAGTVVRAPAEDLPFEDDSFDTAVSTFVLCTVDDPARALAELARVLKPGGELLVMEHVRAEEGSRVALWQDRLEGPWHFLAHGCHPNRRTAQLIEDSPLAVEEIEQDRMPRAAPLVTPMIRGRARAR